MKSGLAIGCVMAGLLVGGARCPAQSVLDNPQWDVVNPGTTGLPGDEVRVVRQAPDGKLWIGARWSFWGDGGLGVYDPVANSWEVFSNVAHSSTGGFPSAFVNDIEFAADGTVWVATNHGLVHRVGSQWVRYTTGNAPLNHNVIESIALHPDGSVWINNSRVNFTDGALLRFDGTNWTKWRGGAGLPWPTTSNLGGPAIDPANGHVWIGAQMHAGLARFDGATWTTHSVESGGIPLANLRPDIVDSLGHVWMDNSPLMRYTGSSVDLFGTASTPLTSAQMTSQTIDGQGRVWAANIIGQVIRQTAPGSSSFVMAYVNPGAHWVSDILPQAAGDLWVSHSGVTMDTGYIKHVSAGGAVLAWYNTFNSGLPDYFISQISRDPQGNMWFSSGEGGLSRFDGERWRNWGDHNKNMEPNPWAGNEPMGGIFFDASGTGWMGGNGIGRWDSGSGTFTGFWDWKNNPGMGTTLYTHFAQDMHGSIYAAGQDGWIFKFNGVKWDILEYYAHNGIHQDSHGNVYSVGGDRVRKWNGTTWANLNVGVDLSLLGPTCMGVGPDDVLWIGTDNGLVRFDGVSGTLYQHGASPLPAVQVRGVDVREDGLVAVACHTFQATTPFPNGVAVIEGDPSVAANWHVYRYGTHPLPHYQLGAVKFDAEGHLWISTISEGCAVALIGTPPCPADFNGDGFVNGDDYDLFAEAFDAGDAAADFNGDGFVNGNDYDEFAGAFDEGC